MIFAKDLEQTLYRRARLCTLAATSILVAIGVLFYAAYVAYYSASITTLSDLKASGADVDQRISALSKESADLSRRLQDANYENGEAVFQESKMIGQIVASYIQEHSLPNCSMLAPSAITITELSTDTQRVLNDTKSQMERWNFKDQDTVNGAVQIPPLIAGFNGCMKFSDWQKLPSFVVSYDGLVPYLNKVRSTSNSTKSAMEAFQTASGALELLESRRSRREQEEKAGIQISKGKLPENTVDSGSREVLYGLIQTSVTRFGSLFVISFLVAILVPLYRYNLRLSAFYIARADAMRFKREGNYETDFLSLSAALTPGYDFGKQPKTPIDKVIELVKAARGKE